MPRLSAQPGTEVEPFWRLASTRRLSTQELLIEEIKHQPEPVLREVWHFLKFLTRQREEEAWADLLPTREVEQERLDILDRDESTPR